MKLRKLLIALPLLIAGMYTTEVQAQTAKKEKTACCAQDAKKDSAACCSKDAKATASTSGCTPSNCRGAQTKFGEAKVITDLRSELIALKAAMEKSATPKFDARSYDIHGIVGEDDAESMKIIVDELQIVENAFAAVTDYKAGPLQLPENKAKQIVYLKQRLKSLSTSL